MAGQCNATPLSRPDKPPNKVRANNPPTKAVCLCPSGTRQFQHSLNPLKTLLMHNTVIAGGGQQRSAPEHVEPSLAASYAQQIKNEPQMEIFRFFCQGQHTCAFPTRCGRFEAGPSAQMTWPPFCCVGEKRRHGGHRRRGWGWKLWRQG